jgi:hypothetical protein
MPGGANFIARLSPNKNAAGFSIRPPTSSSSISRLYIPGKSLKAHDVDNRMKDVMDALQGRASEPKSERVLAAIIPNDCQVYRVTMVKSEPSENS